MPQKARTHQAHKMLRCHKGKISTVAQDIRSSHRWERFSLRMRAAHPLCQWPDGCENVSRSVHHIQKLNDRPDLAFDETNTIPLCDEHHQWCDRQEGMDHATYYKFLEWRELIEAKEYING